MRFPLKVSLENLEAEGIAERENGTRNLELLLRQFARNKQTICSTWYFPIFRDVFC